MDKKKFIDNFESIVKAPNGIQQIRQIVFDLVAENRLFGPSDSAENVSIGGGTSTKKIREIVETHNGNSTSATEKLRLGKNKHGIPYIATKDIGYGFQPIDYENGLLVDESDSNYRRASMGTVLICLEGGSAGKKMALLDREVTFGNKLFANVCKEGLSPEFLLITFLSSNFQRQFKEGMSGIIGGISKSRFSEIEILVPPIAVQDELVNRADFLLALCDEIESEKAIQDSLQSAIRAAVISEIETIETPDDFKESLARISHNWEIMSDSPSGIDDLQKLIYKFAFEGHFSSHLNSDDGAANQWRDSHVGDILTLEYGKPLDKSLRKETGKIPVYGANGIKCYTEKHHVDGPGIVVGRKGSAGEVNLTTGAFWPLDVTFYVVHRPNETDLMYLFHLLKHLDLTTLAHGIKPGINRNDVYRLPVLVPPIAEQRATVVKIEALLALCQELVVSLRERSVIADKFAKASNQLLSSKDQ